MPERVPASRGEVRAIDNRSFLIPGVLPALLGVLAYLPSLGNALAWDDKDLLLNNPAMAMPPGPYLAWAFTTTLGGNWMPLTWLSYGLDRVLFGLSPAGLHLHSALWHGANTFLVFLLARRVLSAGRIEAPGAALLAAMIFGLHPLRVESVAWAAERKDLLYSFFFLWSMLWHLGSISGARCRVCLLFLGLALMCKPMAVTLPVVWLLLDAWPLRRTREERSRMIWGFYLPAFLLAGLAGLVAIWGQGQTQAFHMAVDQTFWMRLENAGRTVFLYLWRTLVPMNLVPFYPFPPSSGWFHHVLGVLALAMMAAISVVLWNRRRDWPAATVGWAFLLVTLAPVLGILQVGGQASADRYTYLTTLPAVVVLAFGLSRLTRGKPWVFAAVTMAITLAEGTLTLRQARFWNGSRAVWERVVAIHPDESSFAHANLAAVLLGEGRLAESLREYERSLAISPFSAEVWAGKGTVLQAMGREQAALEAYEKALALSAGNILAHRNLWVLYGKMNRKEDALRSIRAAVRLDPNDAESQNRLAISLLLLGRLEESVPVFEKAIALDPANPDPLVNLGMVHLKKGRNREAAELLRRALSLRPGDPNVEKMLNDALGR